MTFHPHMVMEKLISELEILVMNMTSHLLSPEEEVNVTELNKQWIDIDEEIDVKYEEIDLAKILEENSEKPGWIEIVWNSLKALEVQGKKLIKTDEKTPPGWGKIRRKSEEFKAIVQMKGGLELLHEMGYKLQDNQSIRFPGFPSSVKDKKTNIARLTAYIIFAKEELAAFGKGEHPNEEIIKEFARTDNVCTDFFSSQMEKATVATPLEGLNSRKTRRTKLPQHSTESSVSKLHGASDVTPTRLDAKQSKRFSRSPTHEKQETNHTISEERQSTPYCGVNTETSPEKTSTKSEKSQGEYTLYASMKELCDELINLEKEYEVLKEKESLLEGHIRQLIKSCEDFYNDSDYLVLKEKADKCRSQIKETVISLSGKKKMLVECANKIEISHETGPQINDVSVNQKLTATEKKQETDDKHRQEKVPELEEDHSKDNFTEIGSEIQNIESKTDKSSCDEKVDQNVSVTNMSSMIKKDTWQCPDLECRFINGYELNECEVCDTPKPVDMLHPTNPPTSSANDVLKPDPQELNSERTSLEDNADLPGMWQCEHCTYKNPSGIYICKMCGKTNDTQKMKCRQQIGNQVKEVAFSHTAQNTPLVLEKMQGSASTFQSQAKTADPYNAKRNEEQAAKKQLQKALLPFYAAMREDADKINNDKAEQGNQWDPLQDGTMIRILTNKNTPPDRRARIALMEGPIKAWYRAENAITLIDAQDTYGEGVTIRHIADQVNQLDGTVEECQKMLRQDCKICKCSYGTDKLQQLTLCECRMCTDCFKTNFEVLIKNKNVTDWHCQVCGVPDMIKNPDDTIIEQHLQFLGIKVQTFLTPELKELFSEKLSDWNLARNPNFVYCPLEGCVNGFEHHERLRVTCTACDRDFCWKCKEPWSREHDGNTCEEVRLAKGEGHIKEEMKEKSIECPNPQCGSWFELARGGCMHFTCPNCKKQFCQCCLRDFYKDPVKGLTCRHPRDCLFHLRDWDIDQLEKLLDDNDVDFENDENPEEKECLIMITHEDEPGKLFETRCEGKVNKGQNGLCGVHYKEHLVKIINENKLDPVDLMEEKEIQILLMREQVVKPAKGNEKTKEAYIAELREYVKAQLPL